MADYPNWFDITARENFERRLLPHLKGLRWHNPIPLKFLQIGVFTGDASVWLLENALRDDDTLTDVDPWCDYDELADRQWDWDDVRRLYYQRTSLFHERVFTYEMPSLDFFCRPFKQSYDFIYIDGAHDTISVLQDAVLAFTRLKHGGLLVFDDYEWCPVGADVLDTPRPAIDVVKAMYQRELNVLHVGAQVWLERK